MNMAIFSDLPNEIIALIASSEGEPSPEDLTPGAPHHLGKKRKLGSSLQPILQPPDLSAWARTCRHFYETVLPLLYSFNRTIQSSSAVAWASHNGCIAALERSKAQGLNLAAPQRIYRLGGNWSPWRQNSTSPHNFVEPIQFAVAEGHAEAVAWFLDHGQDARSGYRNLCDCLPRYAPLIHSAICADQLAVVRLAIDRKASLKYNFRRPLPPPPPPPPVSRSYPMPPPGWIGTGRPISFRSKGHPVRTRTEYDSSLHQAARLGRDDILRYLVLEAGADVRECDSQGSSALNCAMQDREQVSTIETLLELEAPIFGDKWRKSAVHFAITKGYFGAAAAIVEACVKPMSGMPHIWLTTALLWSVAKSAPSACPSDDSELESIVSNDSSSRSDRSISRSRLSSPSDSQSNSRPGTPSSYRSGLGSESASEPGSDSDASDSSTGLTDSAISYKQEDDPWNVQRKSFMLKLIELGVNINNKRKPILTFSQEAWVSRLLLEAGADPNLPRYYTDHLCKLPLSQIMHRRYHKRNTKLWMENAEVLIEYGARVDQPTTRNDVSPLLGAVDSINHRRNNPKLPFLMDHAVINQSQLNDALEVCFQYRFAKGCRELTKYGAQGWPSKEAAYDMTKDIIRKMKRKTRLASSTLSDGSLSDDESDLDSELAPKLTELTFLLRYELSPIHMTLLLAQAIKQKVLGAAHVLLDCGALKPVESAKYLTHLLILAAELGDMGIMRRLYYEAPEPVHASLPLHMAILTNHKGVALFLMSTGVDVLQLLSPAAYSFEHLPCEEDILKRKEPSREGYWRKDKSLHLADSLIHFQMDSRAEKSVSAFQLAVYTGRKDFVRDILRRMSPPRRGIDKNIVHIPCVLADAIGMTSLLAERGFVQE